jgi:hypothetical protein
MEAACPASLYLMTQWMPAPAYGKGVRKMLYFFFMDFENTHNVDIRILQRLLNVGKLRILYLENEIRFGSHDMPPSK